MKLLYGIHNALKSNEEHFQNNNNKNGKLIAAWLLTTVIYIFLILILGKWIWNNVLVNLVSGVNKIKNPLDIIWLHILFSLLLGTF